MHNNKKNGACRTIFLGKNYFSLPEVFKKQSFNWLMLYSLKNKVKKTTCM